MRGSGWGQGHCLSSRGVFPGEAGTEISPTAAHSRKEGRQRGIVPLGEAQVKPLGKRKTKRGKFSSCPSQLEAEGKPLLQTLLEMPGNGNCMELCSSGFCVPGKLSHIQLPGTASEHRAEAAPFPPWGGWSV